MRVQTPLELESCDTTTHAPRSRRFAEGTRDLTPSCEAAVDGVRGEDVADVVHDLASPLATILLALSVIESRLSDDAISRRALDAARSSAGYMERLVANVLACTHGAPAVPARKTVELAELLCTTIARLDPDPERARIVLEVRDRASARVEVTRIERVISQLVENALARSPQESRIVVRLEERHRCARISVIDRGPELGPEEERDIFGHGKGLGLYASLQLVELDGGTIGLEMPEGGGAWFYVELPVATDELDDTSATIVRPPLPQPPPTADWSCAPNATKLPSSMTVRTPTDVAPSSHARAAFAVGGKMGTVIQSTDWSTTALGPIESWPAGLRTTISLALASTFPISIIWGPGHVQIYNDGYWPICGAKHPTSMGQDFRECWAPAFPSIGAAYDRAWSGEADFLENQRMFIDRHGFLEEAFFTFSFSPIRDEAGRVAGLFHPVTETTSQMLSERRTRCLRDLAAHAGNAKNVEEACELVASTLTEFELDLPFVRLYRLSADGRAEHVPALEDEGDASDHAWPFAAALQSSNGIQVDELETRLGASRCGPYPEPPRAAFVLPIRFAGVEEPFGVVVAGVSPRLPLDQAYRDFFDLLGHAIAVAIGNARAYEEERKRAEALAALDRAKTTFFSNISHEFRTPLTLLLGPLHNALASPAASLAGPDLETAHRNAQRLLKLVNQLLDYSRVEARRAEPCRRPTDLSALTADLASAFRSAVEHGGVALNVTCPPLSRPVEVDPDMWEKIVLNLLSNAFKFTFVGSIDVAVAEHADRVELTVRDTGVGIAADQLSRVFERFHRIDGARARTHEGTGIGLALVRDLVALHGGVIDVASEPGRGTTFTVTLPRVGSDSSRIAIAAASEQKDAFVAEALRWLPAPAVVEPSPALTVAAGRILLADDNADMRDYLRRLLGERWAIEVVADGEQALTVAPAGSFDLVIADVMMPGLDGFGLLAALRADHRTAALPIILLSARAGDESIAEGLRAGADDYIVKPFSAGALMTRVESLLAASRARRATQEKAAAERRRLYSLLMDAPAAVCSLRGPEMIIELANARLLALWGRDPSVIGLPLLAVLPELADQPFPELLREVMRSGVPFVANEFLARVDRKQDGVLSEIYFDFIYAPTREDDGTTTGVLVFAVDVTQKVVTRRELEAALGHARDANQAKDDFLALLGHELRNPLAPITTALELIEQRGFAGVEKEAAVIGRQTEHLSHLVDDLLDVSRITSGKVDLVRRVIDLAEIMGTSVELASPLFERKQHHLAVDVAAGILVDVDATRMAQVLSNLLTNAAKYTNPGGAIAFSARVEGDEAVVCVSDNGIGIEPKMLTNVFDMFMQERRSVTQARGGLGLGLTIVKSLVAQHGGSVSAYSEGRGTGARFEVRLPLAHEHAASQPPPRVAHGATTTGSHRVLIVDDNEDAARMLADAMGFLGHDIRVAYDGPSALKVVETFTPELALLDLGLPAMDGYELARRLKETEPLSALRMIAVTGYGQPSDRERTHDAGFDAHLVKPVDVRGLASLIDELLRVDDAVPAR